LTGGSLTSKNGHRFHVTNTNAVITLFGVALINEDASGVLLSVCSDGWSGGGNTATLMAAGQELFGAVLVGSDSDLTLELTDGSAFTGSIGGSITNASGTTVSTEIGTVAVMLSRNSIWSLTADSSISFFDGDAPCVITNAHALYANGIALTGTKKRPVPVDLFHNR